MRAKESHWFELVEVEVVVVELVVLPKLALLPGRKTGIPTYMMLNPPVTSISAVAWLLLLGQRPPGPL